MNKKLTKHGDSWALIIDEPVLELLQIGPETELAISTSGQTLIVTAATADGEHQARLQAAVEKIERKHSKALQRLAE